MKSIVKLDAPLVSPPSDFKGDFFKGMTCIVLPFFFLNQLFFICDRVFCYLFFFSVEIRSGLIGVGLINVEDRSGILSLDKGDF